MIETGQITSVAFEGIHCPLVREREREREMAERRQPGLYLQCFAEIFGHLECRTLLLCVGSFDGGGGGGGG
jgi:hypothetical protein